MGFWRLLLMQNLLVNDPPVKPVLLDSLTGPIADWLTRLTAAWLCHLPALAQCAGLFWEEIISISTLSEHGVVLTCMVTTCRR